MKLIVPPTSPTSHPFYLVPVGENWRVFRYTGRREISHAEYWRQNVAVIVAKYSGVPFGALRELPYCLPRGRYVASCGLPSHAGQAVLFCGEELDEAQREALRASYGELPVLHDEHEVRLPEDVVAFTRLLNPKSNKTPEIMIAKNNPEMKGIPEDPRRFNTGLQKGVRAILAECWPQITIETSQPIKMPFGAPPLEVLLARLEANLKTSGDAFRSKENWRFNTQLHIAKKNESSEKVIEKAFANTLKEGDKWANQVPVCSGYSDAIDSKRAIDLVHDCNEGRFKFIELKTNPNETVAIATVEILLYGLTYILARKNIDKPTERARRLLTASHIELVVLAPAGRFYTKENTDVLSALERTVDTAVCEFAKIQNLGFTMSFSFQVLGEGFDFKKTIYTDSEIHVMANGIKSLLPR